MYTDLIKHRAIVHYKYFLKSIRKVAAHYGIGKSTLCRWLKKDGVIINRKSKTSVLDKINPIINTLISNNPFLTTQMLTKEVYKLLKLKISKSTCSRSLRYNRFTFKRTRLQVRKENYLQGTKLFKDAYLQSDKIISIDETFFYFNEYPKYGYAKRGKQLKHAIKENPKKKKITLYMAVDKDKIVGYKISTTNGNSNDFLDFLKSLNLQNNTILMDNVAFHKTKIVKEYVESTNSNILFVPPYSPDYNPIEMFFSKLKSVYRKIDDEMYLAVSKALESLKYENMSPYFNHVKNLILEIT